MHIDDVAKIVHQINKAYCEAFGDTSQVDWEQAPEQIKQAAISGVKFHLAAEQGPEASHENWMKDKLNNGWTLGDVKDAEKKTHPCLVPFNELPKEQQGKDFVFKAVVEQLAPYLIGKPR